MTSHAINEIKAQPRAASPFPEVRVVDASAGSGKTYSLAKRYVQLLLSSSKPQANEALRDILAITFTNKAALEMKERILHILKTIAFQGLTVSEEKEILAPLGLEASQASATALRMMEAILGHYNLFQVQTIDKFINALLVGCAFKVGLTARFRIKTNAREYLEYALDQTIDQAAQVLAIRQTFEYFVHHYLYLENRTGWFPKRDMGAILYALFMQHNTYAGTFQEGLSTPEDWIHQKKATLEDIKKLREHLPMEIEQRFLKSLSAFLVDNQQSFDIDSISDYFARESVPLRPGAVVPQGAARLWSKIRRGLQQICTQEAYGLFNPYIRVFHMMDHILQEIAVKDDVLFLEALNKTAARLFDEDYVTVPELYYRLASRFRHYLIDEFQDTSRLQWHNLEKMVEEALATGGSLFYVGDRKQAIYGFRGGDISLFDDIRSQFGAFNVRVDYLTQNRRSRKAIVDFNNAVFSADNLKRFIIQKDEYQRTKKKNNTVQFSPEDLGAVHYLFQGAYQGHEPQKEGGYVHIETIPIDKKEMREEIIREKILILIKELHHRYAYEEIAILTRNNAQVEQLTRWLLEDGIPVSSERTSDVTKDSVVGEIIAFLEFLDSPIDNLAFTVFILGDIFSKATGIAVEVMHAFVLGLRERLDREKDFYIYTEFRERFPGIWQEYLDEFFRNVGLCPLYELTVGVYNRFGILRHFPEHQAFLMHLLELIQQKEEDHCDIASFLEYFEKVQGEEVYVHAAQTDAVPILTVHKSKGLEFPVVLLPYLGIDVQVGSSSDDYAPSYIVHPKGTSLELLRLKSKYFNFCDDLYQIYAQEYKKAFACELNNIYVALTRAQDELYAFIPKKTGNTFNLVNFLIPEDIRVVGVPLARVIQTTARQMPLRLPASHFHDWIDYLKDEFQGVDDVRHRHQRLCGEAMHRMLSFIGNLDEVDKRACLDHALQQTRLHFPLLADDKVYPAIERLLGLPAAKPFFYCGRSEVFTEKEIMTAQGLHRRLDRLIIQEKEAWVVDFKSSRDPGGTQAVQVQEYIAVMTAMYPQRIIKGFLVYLDKMEVEQISS